MEKKGNRNLPVSRGPATDSKKDVVTARHYPRGSYSRRREPPGGNGYGMGPSGQSPKPEPSRKQPPQRGYDRRISRQQMDRNEATRLGAPDDDTNLTGPDFYTPKGRKQSLNHLLNFSYSPRETVYRHNMSKTKRHRYNKEHFLQANCQFIVNDKGDYRRYMNDPDALVDWSFVEQINVLVSDFPSCPICLYPPAAAKMTRCGHIYCWSCILHYLSLSDKPWRKCPICYESINKQELKSVVTIPYATLNITETITFKLMKRPKGSLIAYPVDTKEKEDNVMFEMSDKNVGDVYSKLLLATRNDVLNIIDREGKELRRQVEEDEDCPEKCFVEEAITLLKERKDLVLSQPSTNTNMQDDKESTTHYIAVDNYTKALAKVNITTVTEEDIFGIVPGEEETLAAATGTSEVLEDEICNLAGAVNYLDITSSTDQIIGGEQNFSSIATNHPSKYHYFYQSCDGQHIYLHAMNARMLEHTYGSLEKAPKMVTGKILEKESGSMTEDLRKRLRYLQHLPVTCQFEIAEIELKEPVIGRETLDSFKEQIEQRRRRRQRRAKEERRREKRIEIETNRIIGIPVPARPIQIESDEQFPRFEDAMARIEAENATRERSESESTYQSEGSCTGEVVGGVGSFERYGPMASAGPSFATMLANVKEEHPNFGKGGGPSWPAKKNPRTTADIGRYICAAGSKAMSVAAVSNPRKEGTGGTADDGDLDLFERPPQFQDSFGDAVARALKEANRDDGEDQFHQLSGKKKKKSKQKLLFATNMNYVGN